MISRSFFSARRYLLLAADGSIAKISTAAMAGEEEMEGLVDVEAVEVAVEDTNEDVGSDATDESTTETEPED